MDPKTREDYEAELARLRAEIAELKGGVNVAFRDESGGPPGTKDSQGISSTTAGLEEMVLHLGLDGEIRYVNVTMARLLGFDSRSALMGKRLEGLEPHDGGVPAMITAVLESAQKLGNRVVMEREFPALDPLRLPPVTAPRPKSAPILRFLGTPRRGAVEVVVQDVTRVRWLESTFARFVPASVIDQMVQASSADFMAVDRREISMLFVDIRGFTKIAQQLDPSTLCELINQHFTSMVRCIEDQQGTVDKFVGDMVIGLFGAPLPRADHALSALVTASAMIEAHARSMKEWAARGWPTPDIGIGVATGQVVVGNIGSERRVGYTALGHWMNVTSRLCASAGPGEILTLPATHQAALESARSYRGEVPLPRFKFNRLGPRTFKNVDAPMEVLSVSVKAPGESTSTSTSRPG